MRSGRPLLLAPLLLAALAAALPAFAQGSRLTIDDLYDPEKKVDFSGSPPSGLVWTSDTHYLWPKTDPKARATEWLLVEAATGRTKPFFEASKLEAVLLKLPGVSEEEAKRLSHQRQYVTNDKREAFVLTIAGDLYHYALGAERLTRLTFTPEEEDQVTLSPDGAHVGFVRGNDLRLVDVASQRERAVTSDGSDEVLNGKLDWVYQEEIYGRGNYRAYWWSPDSARIAFLRLDERGVPKYTLVDDITTRPAVETWHYPKAGEANPAVRLAVARVAGGAARFVDLDKYSTGEFLIVEVGWTKDSKQVAFQVQNREQTWLDLDLAEAQSGSVKTLLRETGKTWVDNPGAPTWLKDGSFLFLSERTGFKHLYHYKADGTLLRQLTDGRWEVRTLHGVDEAKGLVYFSAAGERSWTGNDLYRIGLDGTGLERLSKAEGSHSATFNPSFSLYVDSWSDFGTPTRVRLHRADGSEARVIDENRLPALAEYELGKPEFVQVETRDGFRMEAMMLKPPDFDPAKKYPVFQQTYAGPHAPQVANRWGGTGAMFLHLLAQRGIIVWVCDNRSASGKGAESAWAAYRRLGETELQDIEDGVAWLARQPYVDASRIGISGWSYGGFMVSYALTHSKSFAMGIAGGPVVDWRNYDSVYTERFMQMPQNNPDGYRRTAPKAAAGDLHGRLLLVHGALDDNVHPQNTMQLAYELQKAGKPFELLLYPKSRHGVTDPALSKHLRTAMLDFITRTLLAPAAQASN